MRRFIQTVLAFAVLAAATLPAFGATITIVNNDRRREGFNDNTAATPVGGNSGTTLGAQRLIVFERAAEIWGAILDSNAEIFVESSFDPLDCDASGGVLGAAGAIQVSRNFTNAPFADTWFHIALANAIAGTDLIPSGQSRNDIQAQFNSDIDNNNNCIAGSNWYYGLDHNAGNDFDLLEVVLHEIGHGLGHANFVNDATGALLSGFPDIYTVFSHDNTVGLNWDQMTDAQRAASAINTGNLVWDGPNVTTAAASFLNSRAVLTINSPAGIAGDYAAQDAAFGPIISAPGISGDVALADDGVGTTSDGCEAFAGVNGLIALIDRGTCNFSAKVKNAQDAGAIAAIVANNQPTGLAPMGGDDPTITIPSFGVSMATGDAIKANLPGVNVTLTRDAVLLAGADDNGRVRLYAPNPVEQGSSVSHWDTALNPDALMEPFATGLTNDDVDLSVQQMQDIGWPLLTQPVCGDGVAEGNEACDGADLAGASCSAQGCNGGTPTCNVDCTLDFSSCTGCPFCGNNVREGSEECDGIDLGGAACGDFGCSGGSLFCNLDCTYDASSCSGCCTDVGQSCSNDGDCCSGNCSNGPPSSRVCQP